jgi:hypothetical protein
MGGSAAAGSTGGSGGKVTRSGTGSFTFDTVLEAVGQNGGNALKSGGTGGTGSKLGGAGGAGGVGGNAGRGGTISVSSNGSNITASANANNDVLAYGGTAGAGSSGGTGGQSATKAGSGGVGAAGGFGGTGGSINFNAGKGTISIQNASSNGGQGGDAGSGGTGGSATANGAGGNGGNGGKGGNGGNGGSVSLLSLPPVVHLQVTANPTGVGSAGAAGTLGSGTPPGNAGQAGPANTTVPLQGHVKISEAIDDDSDSDLQPVSFVEAILTLSKQQLPAANSLLAPSKHNLRAEVGTAIVEVKRGAVAFVADNGDDCSILSLHDSQKGDVKVIVDGQVICLSSGEQLVISKTGSAKSNPLACIAVRHVNQLKLNSDKHVYACDFSIPSAMSSVNTLSRLSQSNLPKERSTFLKILKTSAALQTVGAHKDPYVSSGH